MRYRISKHVQTDAGLYHLVLEAPEIAQTARPGQFLMIRVVMHSLDPLLRRPVSIMDADTGSGAIELLYKVVGRGTRILSLLVEGTDLDVMGPLGNGFSLHPEPHTALLVGGGTGIPPLIFLAHCLQPHKDIDVNVFIGARTGKDLFGQDRFTRYGADITCATENGDTGTRGFVTDALRSFLHCRAPSNPVIYACGPTPMLKALAILGREHAVPTFVSLEEHMGCGVGACMGCVVKTRKGYLTVCSDGPVFDTGILVDW